jgi:AcrR family transcriptional regulator
MVSPVPTKRGQRRPGLLSAARQLFFEHGYAGTTMERVAREAGFSKRTIYLYFKNKDELFLSVGEEGLVLLRERIESIPTDRMSVEEGVATILDVYLRFAREHPQFFRIIFQEATAQMIKNAPEELRRRLEEHERACLSVVASVVKRAVAEGTVADMDPWETAAIFWGAATGIVQLSMGGSQTVFTRKTREEMAGKAVWFLYEGMRRNA